MNYYYCCSNIMYICLSGKRRNGFREVVCTRTLYLSLSNNEVKQSDHLTDECTRLNFIKESYSLKELLGFPQQDAKIKLWWRFWWEIIQICRPDLVPPVLMRIQGITRCLEPNDIHPSLAKAIEIVQRGTNALTQMKCQWRETRVQLFVFCDYGFLSNYTNSLALLVITCACDATSTARTSSYLRLTEEKCRRELT